MANLAQWIKSRFVFAELRRDGEVELTCPWCSKPKKVWFNIRAKRGLCFSCRKSFRVIDFIRQVDSIDYEAAVALLRSLEADADDTARMCEVDLEVPARQDLEFPEESAPVLALESPLGYIARDYLYSRGLTDEDLAFYHVRVAWSERERYRVLFPYWSTSGQLLYWAARRIDTINGSPVKNVYPTAPKRGLLYNLDVARIGRWCVLVEGQIDAVKIGRNGVGIGGSSLHDTQVRALRDADMHTVVVMLDNDQPGRDALVPVLKKLLRHAGWRILLAGVPAGRKDPGECSRQELVDAVSRARPVAWGDLIDGADRLLEPLLAVA